MPNAWAYCLISATTKCDATVFFFSRSVVLSQPLNRRMYLRRVNLCPLVPNIRRFSAESSSTLIASNFSLTRREKSS